MSRLKDGHGAGETHAAAPLARAVRTVGSLTLVSRVAGLARDLVHARLFGDSPIGSAFMAAWAIPNLFRRLFGEGALAAAFIPEYAQLHRRDPETADRFATCTVGLLALVTGGLLVVGEIGLLALLWLTDPADPDRALSFRLVMVMLPFMPLVCVAAILGGMLQTHGRFGPTAAAPIVLNAMVIGAALPFYLAESQERERAAYWIGLAAVSAGLVQVAWALRALRRHVRWRSGFGAAAAPLRRLSRRFVPVVVGMGTIQLNSFLDTLIAMWPLWVGPTILGVAYPMDTSSNAVLAFTQRLYQFPLGVFGVAVATAVFPLLARHAGDNPRFMETLRRGLRLSFFIGLPASAGLVLVRTDLTGAMYAGGGSAFSAEGVARAGAVLLGYAPGVWAYSLNHVTTRAFYASGDMRTPMRIALWMVALNLATNCLLIWPLGEAGLAWSTSLSATVQLVLLTRAARRITGRPVLDTPTLRAMLRTGASTVVMVAAVLLAMQAAPTGQEWADAIVRLGIAVGVGAAAFGAAAWTTRQHELRWLLGRAE